MSWMGTGSRACTHSSLFDQTASPRELNTFKGSAQKIWRSLKPLEGWPAYGIEKYRLQTPLKNEESKALLGD